LETIPPPFSRSSASTCQLHRHMQTSASESLQVQAGTHGGGQVTYWVKREDLSSPLYGGNKVRTLQHLLAACEVMREQDPYRRFNVVGSWGSNQVSASSQ
jgi:1-aminocyclopropane-1-carboxylate deaminase/D-cysteine desulfhydrase-like pyridoxal-dependent ACC family enzyme